MRLQCAVPVSEKFVLQLSALYFRYDVIRQHCRSWRFSKGVVNHLEATF